MHKLVNPYASDDGLRENLPEYTNIYRTIAGMKAAVLAVEWLGREETAGIWRPEVQAAIRVNTLPSYRMLLSGKYYFLRNYFWVPGALRVYEIPDIFRLVAAVSQLGVERSFIFQKE